VLLEGKSIYHQIFGLPNEANYANTEREQKVRTSSTSAADTPFKVRHHTKKTETIEGTIWQPVLTQMTSCSASLF